MSHVVLLGDSIFDNATYVPGGPAVIEQVQGALPDWKATLLAVDGACTPDVERQLTNMPADATHLVLSIGGNDALGSSFALLGAPAGTVRDALGSLASLREQFRKSYRAMLDRILKLGKPTIVCTIYDSIPQRVQAAELAGLALFNDVITREAFRSDAGLIDLRLVCREPGDYAAVSPIEPSVAGGEKIAQAIARALTQAPGSRRVVV